MAACDLVQLPQLLQVEFGTTSQSAAKFRRKSHPSAKAQAENVMLAESGSSQGGVPTKVTKSECSVLFCLQKT